eukprot:882411-Rhodomonas_salina.2
MRTLYAALAELLSERMRARLGGKEPPVHVPPHWRHGHKSAAQVLADIRSRHAQFLNGSWI